MFGERLRQLRRERKITQQAFARDLQVAQNTVSNWENGGRQPNLDMLRRIADYFAVRVDYLLGDAAPGDDADNGDITFDSFTYALYGETRDLTEENRQKLLEMAQVFSMGTGRKIGYIYVSQLLPYLISGCSLALGLCWKAGTAAEVIGIPAGSIGEKLYHAKIYLNTPDLFAWTIVIIGVSFSFEKCFLMLLRGMVRRIERT